MKNVLLFIFLIVHLNTFSQEEKKVSEDYHHIDSVAKTIKFKNDIRLLSYDLTKNYTNDIDKARSIFIWITNNIVYDYKILNKKKQKRDIFKCKKKDNCEVHYAAWEDQYLKKVITKGKGICDGYSRLFKKLCDHAGIQGSIVTGYIKNQPSQIGRMGILDHAWNVILIDGKYYYIDATWAAGSCIKNKKGKYYAFNHKLEEYYWLTPVEKLSRDHFPSDSLWIKHTTYKKAKEQFRQNIYIKTSEMPGLDVLAPDSGIIKIHKGDTIQFRFTYKEKPINHVQVNTNIASNPTPWIWEKNYRKLDLKILEDQEYIAYTTEGDTYTFNYIADHKNLSYIDILIDYNIVMRFKITIIK